MKLWRSLSYFGVDPELGFKKKQHLQKRKTYNKNRSHVRYLIDAGFIPFSGADADTLLDVVNDNTNNFFPHIINLVDDEEVEYDEEWPTSLHHHSPTFDPGPAPTPAPA